MTRAGEPRPLRLSLAPELRGNVRVGVVSAARIVVEPTAGRLAAEIEAFCAELRERHGGRTPAEIVELAPARELYRTFGIDPTKMRPSSEKLLRRVLASRPLPRISSAVDLGNLLALRFLLPIGLFDRELIDGDVVLRAGAPGEAYEGIAGRPVHLGGRPVLADSLGAFGNPTADSARTAVGAETTSLWMTVFAPASVGAERLRGYLEASADAFARHLGRDVHTSTDQVA